jgi:hypothetical protein
MPDQGGPFLLLRDFSEVPERKALTDFEEGSIFPFEERSNGGDLDETGEKEIPASGCWPDFLSATVFSLGL